MEEGEKKVKQEDCSEDNLGSGVLTLTNRRIAFDKTRARMMDFSKHFGETLVDIQLKESRTISDVKSFGISAPLVYFVNLHNSSIIMQYIPGKPLHDLAESKIISLSKQMGSLVGVMHKNGLMHGDLTTSNFIFYQKKLYIIDFGLSHNSVKPEDHAVDLRLIKEILNSAHARIMEKAWNNFLLGYKSVVGNSRYFKILNLVADIESRGRYATVV